jgi:hypothetical protein
MEVKAVLRIAYSNQKVERESTHKTCERERKISWLNISALVASHIFSSSQV